MQKGTTKHPHVSQLNPHGVHPKTATHHAGQTEKNILRLVFWETTAGCNLECIHCRRLDVSKELMESDLKTDEAKAFIDSLAEAAKPILVLSGGEPLYRPDIFDLARHAASRGLKVALATNGTLVSESIAKDIVAAGIERVSISLDGADSQTHNEFRRLSGSFEQAVRGFNFLKRLGMSLQINCTIARHNVHQLRDLYNLAVGLGADALHIFMLVPVGCGVEIAEDQMLPAEQYEEALNLFYDLSKEAKIQTKATCAPHYYRIMRQRARAEGTTLEFKSHGMAAVTKGCLAGTGVCFVSHEGEVFPCGYLPVHCGDVRKQSFVDIWQNSEVFKRLRNPELLEGKCGICEYKKVCEGCRARAFYQTGNYLAEEPYCLYKPKIMQK